MEADAVQPALDILESLDHVSPREPLIVGGVRVRGQPLVDEAALRGTDELGRVWVVLDKPIRSDSDDHGGDALEDEDPAPAVLPDHTAHVTDTLAALLAILPPRSCFGTYICEDTAKGTSQRRSTEEKADAILPLSPFVPHAEVEHDSREQTALGDTEKES